MQCDVKNATGTITGSIELNDAVYASDVSKGSLYHTLRNQLARARQGTAATKGRSDVNYSNRKPWRQKGTGRARAGSRRSPVWVGGGTVFGPQPRDYSYTLPKKIRRLAYKSALSERMENKTLQIIELEALQSQKTKDFYAQIISFNKEKKPVLLVIQDDNTILKRVARNIPWLTVHSYDKLAIKNLIYASRVLLTKEAALLLNDFFTKEQKDAEVS